MRRRAIFIMLVLTLLAAQVGYASQPVCLMGQSERTEMSAPCCCEMSGTEAGCETVCAQTSPDAYTLREAVRITPSVGTAPVDVAVRMADVIPALTPGLQPTQYVHALPKRYLRACVLRL